MIDDQNTNHKIETCLKITESFEDKEQLNLSPFSGICVKHDQVTESSLQEKEKINSLTNVQQADYMLTNTQINQQSKGSSIAQIQNFEAREYYDGEMKNYPRQLANKSNILNQLQISSSYPFQKPTKVLIVDDTYFNIIAMKLLLKNVKNLIIEEAYNGQQALDILNISKLEYQNNLQKNQEDIFQIIFMDINMPIMDGIECTINIRKDPFYQDIKIIAVTAYSSASESQKCIDAGMDAHICKPISKQDCLSVLLNLKH